MKLDIKHEKIKAIQEAYETCPKLALGFCKTGNQASTLCRLALE